MHDSLLLHPRNPVSSRGLFFFTESLDRFQAPKFSLLLLYFTGSRGLGQKKNQHSVIRVSGSSCPFSGAKFLNTARTVHTPQRLPIDYDRPWWGECVKEESERGRRSNGVSPVPSLPLSLTQWVHEYWVSIPSTRVPSHRMEEVEVSRRWLGFVLGGLTGKYLPSSDISWPSMRQHKTMWMRLFNCSGRISEQHIGGEEPVDEETLWAEIKVVCSTSV